MMFDLQFDYFMLPLDLQILRIWRLNLANKLIFPFDSLREIGYTIIPPGGVIYFTA
jgi:hypothetical protein